MAELHTRALELIKDYLNDEFKCDVTMEKMWYAFNWNLPIGLGHTTLGPNNEYPVQVCVDLHKLQMLYEVCIGDGEKQTKRVQYKILESLIKNELECLNFNDLIGECHKYLEELLGKEID